MGFAALLLGACDQTTDTKQNTAAMATTTATVSSTKQSAQPLKPEVVMYKPPTCDCCTGWAEHLRKDGFTVVVHKRDDMDVIKSKYEVTDKLASCHTAIVDGYVIEGHVPAADVERLLKERPDVVGLTAPGMPMKSPGMQTVGQKPEAYDVLAFDKDGNTTVFHKY
ncbi:DUF411 domain-containing protein [Mariprofundus sp. EBB-1]|nr:DUF411 domain-containing protein [Mariprofundus sp. EBB-1]